MATDLKSKTVVDTLAKAVRERILAGDYRPGDRVTEQDVADLYGVARPTAKAAIERIAQLGLLRRSANKTAMVTILSSDEIADLFRSRIFFECQAVSMLAEEGRVPAACSAALAAMSRGIEADSKLDRVAADIDFHIGVVAGLESERISRMYDTIIGETHLCMSQDYIGDSQTALAEHEAVINAIAQKNVSKARALMRAHLDNAVGRVNVRAKRAIQQDGGGLVGSRQASPPLSIKE